MSLKRKVKFKNNYKKAFVFKTIDSGLKFLVLKEFIPNNINAFKKIYTFLFNKKISNSLTNTKAFSKKITFRFSQNNIFVNFVDLFNNKTLHTGSSGIYKIKLSKRRIKTFYRTFVYIFFNKIKKNVKDFRNTVFSLIAPIKIRKMLVKIILSEIKKLKKRYSNKKNILINIVPKKCFNGCRAKKKVRKKGRFYKIYK